MNIPLVSIVVATYRRDVSLEKALGSLASQTYPSIEIALVDDNADKSWNEIVRNISQTFRNENPSILFQHIENYQNEGSAQTRNIGIQTCRGEYITFLDDDDLYLPEKIEHQVSSMIESGSDYCLTDLCLYNKDEKLIERRTRNYIELTSPKALTRYHLMYHMTGTDTMMFRKEYLEKIGGFPMIDVGDEFYLMERAINGGGVFNYLNRCDVKAYIHVGSGGLSSGESKVNGENLLYAYKTSFFAQIPHNDVRYIRMRHYAVLAFAYLRQRRYFDFVSQAIKSFLSMPIECIRLLLEVKRGF